MHEAVDKSRAQKGKMTCVFTCFCFFWTAAAGAVQRPELESPGTDAASSAERRSQQLRWCAGLTKACACGVAFAGCCREEWSTKDP